MAAKLTIITSHHNRRAFQIAWMEDDEEGLTVGEDSEWNKSKLPGKNDPGYKDAWETYIVAKTLREAYPGIETTRGLEWETEAQAKAALRLAKEALKNGDMPMPDWAKTALQEGWKPPKGWKAK